MDKALDPVIECPLAYPGEAESARGYAVRAEEAANRAEDVVGGLGNLQSLVDAAKESEEAAANSAGEAAGSADAAKISEDNAAASAVLAQQAASASGFMQMGIDDAGHLIYKRTTNLKEKIKFAIVDDTNLEVQIYG